MSRLHPSWSSELYTDVLRLQPEEIKASMAEGVLTVTFPRTSPEQAPKKIAIQ